MSANVFHPSRGGVRGGKDQFNWDDVKTDKDRENYLGHSLKAPVGRWQQGKDLAWYTRDKNDAEAEANARKKEVKSIKEIEAQAMAAALGYPFVPASTSKKNEDVAGNAETALQKSKNAHTNKESKKKKKVKKEKKKRKKRKHRSSSSEEDSHDEYEEPKRRRKHVSESDSDDSRGKQEGGTEKDRHHHSGKGRERGTNKHYDRRRDRNDSDNSVERDVNWDHRKRDGKRYKDRVTEGDSYVYSDKGRERGTARDRGQYRERDMDRRSGHRKGHRDRH